MEMVNISRKYKNYNEWKWYVNILKVKNYIEDLYNYGYIVSVCEFLKINKKWTQPFMEYSLWKEEWYNLEDLIIEVEKLEKIIIEKWFKKEEVFFDVLVK